MSRFQIPHQDNQLVYLQKPFQIFLAHASAKLAHIDQEERRI